MGNQTKGGWWQPQVYMETRERAKRQLYSPGLEDQREDVVVQEGSMVLGGEGEKGDDLTVLPNLFILSQ